jgi:hypothetical protein
LRIQEEQLENHKKKYDVISLHAVGNMLCVIILISMRCDSNLFYVSYFKFLYNFFLKFIVHKMNSKMVKPKIIKLIMRDKTDMTDADVIVCWIF